MKTLVLHSQDVIFPHNTSVRAVTIWAINPSMRKLCNLHDSVVYVDPNGSIKVLKEKRP